MHFYTASLQPTENSGIQLYKKFLESIIITPASSYDKHVEENKCILNLKKLSNEIILDTIPTKNGRELVEKWVVELMTNF